MAENQSSRTALWIVLGVGAFMVFVVAVFSLVYLATKNDSTTTLGSSFGQKIGVIKIEGIILTAQPTVDDLKKFGDDDSIKAIILHMNTPGGGAAASQEIYEAVKRIRDKKKKTVVTSIETVGASGGYYIAMGGNKIYANPSSVVGSIGVIAQWYNYGDLMHWAKIRDITLKAGELKDAGTPTRDLTPKEREYFQGLIDDMHSQFIQAVSENRKMKVEDLRPLASGRVWTGAQAQPLKLIDGLADFQTVVDETAKSVGIKGEPTLVRPTHRRPNLFDILFGDAASELIPTPARLMQKNVGFYYLWR